MLFAGSCFWSGIRYLSKNSQETALSMGHTIFIYDEITDLAERRVILWSEYPVAKMVF